VLIGNPERVDASEEEQSMARKITPFLWFDDNAEEATHFYVSIFKNSEVLSINRMGDAGPGGQGTVLTTSFRLDGQEFVALNGGPMFKFTEAVSFVIDCKSQEEVDDLWEKLSAGGETSQCGWLKDKFGLSWQVIPSVLSEMLGDQDAERANRVMQAMLQMTKIDIPKLQEAYDQK
jgi:predicted 3-demethylubiquinone-9 3-methyltransferase (glyoxalase superfamily)